MALIQRCGGPDLIIKAAEETRSKITDRSTVYRWSRIGVPERHWGLIMTLSGATPNQLHGMNERLRRSEALREDLQAAE